MADSEEAQDQTPDLVWLNEPTPEEQAYASKAMAQLRADPEGFKKLLEINPDRPILEQVNEAFHNLGMDMSMSSIEPMPVCYDTPCKVCEAEIPAWTDGYYGLFSHGQNAYLCGDRGACMSRIMGKIFQIAVKSDEDNPTEEF